MAPTSRLLARRHACPGLPGLTCLGAVILALSPVAAAFEFSGSKWPGAQTEIYIDINGLAPSQVSWNQAFVAAALEWNRRTDFNFVLQREYLDPCLSDGRNGVDFTADLCGSAFQENTLAVTLRKFTGSILGPAAITEADIVFNEGVDYNIYDGRLVQFGVPGLDFRRVALHELGHVIGLDHESRNVAIMAPRITDLDRLQADDVAGANALYGGLSRCAVMPLRFSLLSGALEEGDCRVNELTAGGSDDSFIDLYRFSLDDTAQLEFAMTSDSLDSVMLIADADLNILVVDDGAFQTCNSSLSLSLGAGEYYLLANTFIEPIKEDCGNSGSYQLTASFTASETLPLGANSSLLGTSNAASFRGGISADNGQTYGNLFSADDSLDIFAEIMVDPSHVGQPGFLVIAANLDGVLTVRAQSGEFLAYDPSQPIARFRERVLSAVEPLEIAENLIPRSLGIDSIRADFYVGYGLDADPEELFFHDSPLSLIVTD